MFISRKDYEKAIKEAKAQGRKEAEKEFLLRERFDRLEENMWKRTNEIHERIDKLQFEKNYGFEPAEKCSCPPQKSC